MAAMGGKSSLWQSWASSGGPLKAWPFPGHSHLASRCVDSCRKATDPSGSNPMLGVQTPGIGPGASASYCALIFLLCARGAEAVCGTGLRAFLEAAFLFQKLGKAHSVPLKVAHWQEVPCPTSSQPCSALPLGPESEGRPLGRCRYPRAVPVESDPGSSPPASWRPTW